MKTGHVFVLTNYLTVQESLQKIVPHSILACTLSSLHQEVWQMLANTEPQSSKHRTMAIPFYALESHIPWVL